MQLDLFDQQEITLYPSMASVEEARTHIMNKLPIENPVELHCLLMMYQNTLIDSLRAGGSLPGTV